MLRRSFAAVFVLALIWTMSFSAQAQNAPQKMVIIDINSASEADIASVGIDKPVAKKIVEGRPYRNKRDLVARSLLTMDQYDKTDKTVLYQPTVTVLIRRAGSGNS